MAGAIEALIFGDQQFLWRRRPLNELFEMALRFQEALPAYGELTGVKMEAVRQHLRTKAHELRNASMSHQMR